jgi:ferritin-like protein
MRHSFYTAMCEMAFGKDHRTFDRALAILGEEVEGEAWFSAYSSEGRSGHFRRGAPGEASYVPRFMTSDFSDI